MSISRVFPADFSENVSYYTPKTPLPGTPAKGNFFPVLIGFLCV
jgi:hypothetical protein